MKNEQKEKKKNRTSCTSSAASHPKSVAHDLRKAQEPQQQAEMLQGAGSLLGHPGRPHQSQGQAVWGIFSLFCCPKDATQAGGGRRELLKLPREGTKPFGVACRRGKAGMGGPYKHRCHQRDGGRGRDPTPKTPWVGKANRQQATAGLASPAGGRCYAKGQGC